MKTLPYTGQTPKGRGFTVSTHRLEWHASGEVGSIGVPLRGQLGRHDDLIAEIESTGHVSDELRKTFFAC